MKEIMDKNKHDDFVKMFKYRPKKRGNNKIDNHKTQVVNYIETQIKDIISTLIVKKEYIASRYEDVEMSKAADEYVSTMKGNDIFWTYKQYSEYALQKAGVTDMRCRYDKTLIPKHLRNDVLRYQREYTEQNYVELNNYYRSLYGLPDIGDDFIFIDKPIEGVDISKPIHDMSEDEIIILTVNGEIDKLKKKYPDKKYLNHLLRESKVDFITARTASDFEIIGIKRDRNKELFINQFITSYNEARNYILTRFRDDAYVVSNHNEYYDGFVGMLILVVAIQRFISNFYYNLINRDFFDKDLIRSFFISYNIPFYENIPLNYLNNIAKNLNRLLMYKATDKVFVNIFKIFGLKNVNIQNYILFKDVKLDIHGNPIQVYKENKDLGYIVSTRTSILSSTKEKIVSKTMDKTNIEKIRYFNWKGLSYRLYYRFNKIVSFDSNVPKEVFGKFAYKKSDTVENEYDFTENINIIKVFEVGGKNNRSFILLSREMVMYYLSDNGIKSFDLKTISNGTIVDVFFKYDNKSKITCIGLNYNDNCELFVKGTFQNAIYSDLTCVHRFRYSSDKIVNISMKEDSIVATLNNGAIYVMGDNSYNQLHIEDKKYIDSFTEVINNAPVNVVKSLVCEKGTIFIIDDGSVRWTGEIPEFNMPKTTPGFNELKPNFKNIKDISILNDGEKPIPIIRYYNDSISIYNYRYSDKFGVLLYNNQLYNQKVCKYKFIKDIIIYPEYNEMILTQYNQHVYSNISVQKDEKEHFSPFMTLPYVKSNNIIEETDCEKMRNIEIHDGILYFIDEYDNVKFYDYVNKTYKKINIDGVPQSLFNTKDYVFVTTGEKFVYKINKDDGEVKIDTTNHIVVEIIDNLEEVVMVTSNNNILVYKNGNLRESDSFNPKTLINGVRYEVYTDIKGQYHIKLKSKSDNIDKPIKSLYNCINILVYDKFIVLNGDRLSYIKLDDIIDDNVKVLEPVEMSEINKTRVKYKVINNDIINFNYDGGISLLSKFSLINAFNADIDDYFVSLYGGNPNSFISDFTINGSTILFLRNKNDTLTYVPDCDKMYDLHFVEVPFDTNNLSDDLCKFEKFSQYELVVDDDDLWGDEDNKKDFKREILNSEFNYIYTKYISVTSTYNITKLNFETCYMFKMLDDLKPNENLLTMTLPYVGDCKLFDLVVALYALASMKMGSEGNIIDTTTKAMSVLGFNFNQDIDYIKKAIEEKLDPGVIDKVTIHQPPKIYLKSPEVVNTFLDNKDVYDYIVKAKYEAKSIKEYNAYKRIMEATLYSNYSNKIYNINGKLPATYLDYIKASNIALYKFLKETDNTNIVNQIDIILTTLDEYLHSDKFEYLFNSIPSLSMDNIRKFIYYLIETFKSYKIELKSLNIVYEVDDKYIHNLKLVLDEDGFKKMFIRRDMVLEDFCDVFEVMHKVLHEGIDIELTKEIILRAMETVTTDIDFKEKKTFIKKMEQIDTVFSEFSDMIKMCKTHSDKDIMNMVDSFILKISRKVLESIKFENHLSLSSFKEISDKLIESFSDLFSLVDSKFKIDDNTIQLIEKSLYHGFDIYKTNIKFSEDLKKYYEFKLKDTIKIKDIRITLSRFITNICRIKCLDKIGFNANTVLKDNIKDMILDKFKSIIVNNVLNDCIPLNMSDGYIAKSKYNLSSNINIRDNAIFIRN